MAHTFLNSCCVFCTTRMPSSSNYLKVFSGCFASALCFHFRGMDPCHVLLWALWFSLWTDVIGLLPYSICLVWSGKGHPKIAFNKSNTVLFFQGLCSSQFNTSCICMALPALYHQSPGAKPQIELPCVLSSPIWSYKHRLADLQKPSSLVPMRPWPWILKSQCRTRVQKLICTTWN